MTLQAKVPHKKLVKTLYILLKRKISVTVIKIQQRIIFMILKEQILVLKVIFSITVMIIPNWEFMKCLTWIILIWKKIYLITGINNF